MGCKCAENHFKLILEGKWGRLTKHFYEQLYIYAMSTGDRESPVGIAYHFTLVFEGQMRIQAFALDPRGGKCEENHFTLVFGGQMRIQAFALDPLGGKNDKPVVSSPIHPHIQENDLGAGKLGYIMPPARNERG